jgi:two-component system alkaline phosphatase synthesis response regulator PhoP
MKLIYCVEDDEGIRELIICALNTADFQVKGFADSHTFYAELNKTIPDIILLDIMLPDTDGLTILKDLKQHSKFQDIPVIMITAKSLEIDKVKGLESGADDYITKPFGVLELLARVKAVLRRGGPKKKEEDILKYNGLILDYKKRNLTYKDKVIDLTFKEFELLYYLMLNKGIVLTRDIILQKIWGYDFEGETRTVDMHIKTIRQKLELAGCPNPLKTIRGVGYKFEDLA